MDNKEEKIDCCLNCSHYEPKNSIQCIPLAEGLNWDREEMKIDSADTLKCKHWSEK